MKKLIIAALMTSSAFAQSITGVAVLKGSLKTKVNVNNIPTTCKVKVDKIRNIMEEDAFGFPGYRVIIKVDLSARGRDNEILVNFDREFTLVNFWNVGGRTVAKDLEYFSPEGALLMIKPDGRLKSFSFPFEGQTVTCSF